MKKLILLIILSAFFKHSFSTEVLYKDSTARDFKLDHNNKIYVLFNQKIVKYSITGEIDKVFELTKKDSLINMFLMPNNSVLLATKNSKYLYLINDNFKLVDSIDTKKIGGFHPSKIVTYSQDEFIVYDEPTNRLKVYDFNFMWKVDINYDVSSLGKNWKFINGFGGGYRYFFSPLTFGVTRTDNNGVFSGFLPVGTNVFEFYTSIKNREERLLYYNKGSFINASFNNIIDTKVMNSIPSDSELSAMLLNEIAIKFYKDKFVIVQLNNQTIY